MLLPYLPRAAYLRNYILSITTVPTSVSVVVVLGQPREHGRNERIVHLWSGRHCCQLERLHCLARVSDRLQRRSVCAYASAQGLAPTVDLLRHAADLIIQ